MANAAQRLTVDDWYELDEEDRRELVRGVLEEPEMVAFLHDAVVAFLVSVLAPYFRAHGGFTSVSNVKLAIRRDTGRMADILAYVAGNKPESDGLVRTAPDIVVEVISKRPRDVRRDRIDKARDYASMGAKQYWLVDPHVRSFEILRLNAKRHYVNAVAVTEGTLRVPGFPGLVIDVDALWAEVDRLT